MTLWNVYYRYRKNYERGGPWVYIHIQVFANSENEAEVKDSVYHSLCPGSEIVRLENRGYRRIGIVQGTVVSAKEARGEW